jgi:hypothetical protein
VEISSISMRQSAEHVCPQHIGLLAYSLRPHYYAAEKSLSSKVERIAAYCLKRTPCAPFSLGKAGGLNAVEFIGVAGDKRLAGWSEERNQGKMAD